MLCLPVQVGWVIRWCWMKLNTLGAFKSTGSLSKFKTLCANLEDMGWNRSLHANARIEVNLSRESFWHLWTAENKIKSIPSWHVLTEARTMTRITLETLSKGFEETCFPNRQSSRLLIALNPFFWTLDGNQKNQVLELNCWAAGIHRPLVKSVPAMALGNWP